MKFVYEHLHQIIASIGYILDIIGAILIWRFGLPEFINRGGHRQMFFVGDDFDVDNQMLAQSYDRWSTLGLCLLVIGFLLEITSTWMH
ncbi:MAG: hypothetical protein IPL32_03255 [Chloracidobacterium sp.]|nr:hypothetical protein [Chloracidobacterium sp.]